MNRQQKELYSDILESQLVLAGSVHHLLKKYKEDNKDLIRLSGNKPELVENLLHCVEEGVIDIKEIQALIKDSEEFGDQYIYIYKTLDGVNDSDYHDGKMIADAILPKNEREKFPKIMDMPTKTEWADFRSPNRGINNSWLVKLYDKKVRRERQNEWVDDSTGFFHIVYKEKPSRVILMAEWDGKQLEIKIGRTTSDSTTSVLDTRRKVEQLIAPGVFIQRDFTKKDLSDTIHNILINWDTNKNIYKLLSVKLVDSHSGQATISTNGEDELDLLSDKSRKEAIEAYLNSEGRPNSLAIQLLAEGSGDVLSSDVNVVLGKNDINEIIIPANISPQEYKYVRKKIAEFS
ncbi:hypothetical protein LZ575_03000 [Antarcticibacterium sp. 1MA-6-2]|uniref:hypothetical protein n=1 Tax=Antarcticibacterium sp. 1MA-6-2 TaxID=2908210 RepID=UPI001F1DCEE3|nr:hypothetical protein [Antarcticibacterium sp. 1MA-6-2]UJH91670.1 hypothetical protein LZ575_03000 [Antarcticibacterium sp. 1MA-6-2]